MDISTMSPEMIPALSTIMANNKVQTQAGELVFAKVLDTNESSGQALIDMMRSTMERSVNPSVGANIDISL